MKIIINGKEIVIGNDDDSDVAGDAGPLIEGNVGPVHFGEGDQGFGSISISNRSDR